MIKRILVLTTIVLCVRGTPLVAQSQPSLLIENVTLIDGTGRAPIARAFVLTDGDRIVRVSREQIDAPTDAVRIDGRGKYLIPGLMDMHVHLTGGRGRGGPDIQAGKRALHGFLYSGITTIYDAGNNPDYILDFRAQERAWQIVSPRIFATGGLVTVPGGHGDVRLEVKRV